MILYPKRVSEYLRVRCRQLELLDKTLRKLAKKNIVTGHKTRRGGGRGRPLSGRGRSPGKGAGRVNETCRYALIGRYGVVLLGLPTLRGSQARLVTDVGSLRGFK